jgi:hypothetical protein
MGRIIDTVKTWPVIKQIITITYRDVVKRGLFTPFLIFIFFVLSFAVQRLAAMSVPKFNIIIHEYHIHHFYFGLIFLIISNWIILTAKGHAHGKKLISAIIFGIGLGVIADEIGLLLTCTSPLKEICDYHARVTWDFFIVIVGLFMSILYFVPIWNTFKNIVFESVKFVWEKIIRR